MNQEVASISNEVRQLPIVSEEQFRNLREKHYRSGSDFTLRYCRTQVAQSQWPIGLCIAWALTRNMDLVARQYAERRARWGEPPPESWGVAQNSVLRALAQGEIEATGLIKPDGRREVIPRKMWPDFRIVERGSYDEVRTKAGAIAFYDVKIDLQEVQDYWRENKKLPTKAASNAAAKAELEMACLDGLVQLMMANPDKPTPKIKLRTKYPSVGPQAFDRLYRQAFEIANTPKWGLPGRRPCEPY